MSNTITELSGSVRVETGKGATHRLRRLGNVPAVVYGGGKEALSVSVSPKEATKILQGPLRRNVMIHLNLEGVKAGKTETKTVMVRDVQIDPVRREMTHLDFVEVDAKSPISVHVPLILFGKSKSVQAGGQLDQIKHTLKVKVLPGEVPHKLELDVSELEFGSTPASAVVLPKGVELDEGPMNTVVSIHMPRAEKEETPAAGAAPAAPAAAAATGDKK